MSYYFNEDVKNKSFIIVFYKNNTVDSAISFSIPPQNFQIRQAQRINQTKTFGGIVFDDYGNDVVKISMSGTTVNQHARYIYNSENNTEIVSGEEEIFKINKTIQKYGELENLQGKKVVLYNLDTDEKSHLYWQILIDSFTIKQSKDKPLCYDYSLECTGIPDNREIKKSEKNNSYSLYHKSVEQISNNDSSKYGVKIIQIKSLLNLLHNILNKYSKFLDIYTELNKLLDDLERTVKLYENAIKGIIDVNTSIVTETKHLGERVIKTAFRITMGTGLNIYNSAAKLVEATKDLVVYCRNLPDEVTKTFNSYLYAYAETTDDIINNIITISKDIQYSANDIYKNAKKNVGVYDNVIIPGDENTDDEIKTIYGFENKTVNYGDTWASIAEKYYGDPSLSSLIASYNHQISFTTGNTIYIPKLIPDTNYQLSEIYNPYDSKDNYGKDIKLSKNSDIESFNGDFQVITGKSNLSQAINNRLSTDVNSRIRLITYGIKAKLGSPTMSKSFILASINETVSREPRIKSVDNISFKGIGDKLYISITYTDINNNQDIYGGLI